MHPKKFIRPRKALLAGAIALALGSVGMPRPAAADVFTFSWSGEFTMLGSTGLVTANGDAPGAPWYTNRTPITGTMVLNTTTGAGSGTVKPFSFFGGGLAKATNVTMQAIGNGSGGAGPLVLGNMGFNWNGNNGIPVSIVLDAQGLFGAIQASVTSGQVISGVGALAASNDTVFGGGRAGTYTLPLGPSPVVTTTWNTTNIGSPALGTNPSGSLPLIADTVADASNGDTGIGGSPMQTSPFPNFNANFDMTSLKVTTIAPSAVADTTSVSPGGAVEIKVLANDVSTTSPLVPASVTVSTLPTKGATSVDSSTGTITYTNTSGKLGNTDTFQYTVKNKLEYASPPATVTVHLAVAGSKPPVIGTPTLSETTPEGTPLALDVLTAAGVTDPSNLAVTVKSVGTPKNGSATRSGSTITYTPNKFYNGPDSFTYVVTDANGGTATGTVKVKVTFVDNPPTANPDTAVTPLGTPVTVNVLAHDTDPDIGTVHGDKLTVTTAGTPAHGTAKINTDGTITYTPNSGYVGKDTFTYTISDTSGKTSTANVTVTVLTNAYSGVTTPDNPGAEISPSVSGGSNFTMLNPAGADIGGTNDLKFTWDGTLLTSVSNPKVNATLASPTPFFGFPWTTHDVQIFGPGTYTFEACPPPINSATQVAADGSTHCTGPKSLTMKVKPGEVGAHMLFDWNGNNNIDVVMVWKVNHTWTGAVNGTNSFGASGAPFNLAVAGDTKPDGTPVMISGHPVPGHPMVDGPFIGFRANFNLNFNPPYALPVVSATTMQGGKPIAVVVPSGGPVTITASSDTAGVTYDWSTSDAALKAVNSNGTTSSTFVFDPSTLPSGKVVTARVTITDPATKEQSLAEVVPLRVDSTLTLAQAQSTKGNGIPDYYDHGPSAVTELQGKPSGTFLLQSTGKLVLGSMAEQIGAGTGKYGAILPATDLPKDPDVTQSCVGGCFDFDITGITTPPGSAQVVLPLLAPIPPKATYRKFVNGTWRNFFLKTSTVEGGKIASAPHNNSGTCPPPGTAYKPGLTKGDFCVQLTLNDGGRNDADGAINGTIVDPGGVAGASTSTTSTVSTVGTPDVGSSGCSISPTPVSAWRGGAWWLIGTVIGWLGFSRRRRSARQS